MVALNSRSNHDRAQRTHAETKSVSVQTSKVTYRGVDGAYYTSTRARSRGSDGVINFSTALQCMFCHTQILL